MLLLVLTATLTCEPKALAGKATWHTEAVPYLHHSIDKLQASSVGLQMHQSWAEACHVNAVVCVLLRCVLLQLNMPCGSRSPMPCVSSGTRLKHCSAGVSTKPVLV
jgi:hypothetical protein